MANTKGKIRKPTPSEIKKNPQETKSEEKETFPNLVKEIDMQVQEAQSPKQDGRKEDHSKTHHN